jgi:hypothetical protein
MMGAQRSARVAAGPLDQRLNMVSRACLTGMGRPYRESLDRRAAQGRLSQR